MFKTITASFLLALQNIRSNFFHTILSLLGIVIGVAALVSILSLIDGMEKYAQDQISRTTSLQAIMVQTQSTRIVNGVAIKKDSFQTLSVEDFKNMKASITKPVQGIMYVTRGKELRLIGDSIAIGSRTTAVSNLDTTFTAVAGRLLSDEDFEKGNKRAIVTPSLADKFVKEQLYTSLIDRRMVIGADTFIITAVAKSSRLSDPELIYPITSMSAKEVKESAAGVMFQARDIIDVQPIKKEIESWIKSRFGEQDDFSVSTNEFRVEQAAQGFKLFRIIMGMIVGISVLVGGIGVMNVLLISVTERTSEIGVRKAVGANRKDIILQFLSESITISMFGSLIGLVVGILFTMAFVPIVKSITKVPFQAAYTLNTLIVISVISVIIGIVFGTYPAMRAAKLDPVEAIRRE